MISIPEKGVYIKKKLNLISKAIIIIKKIQFKYLSYLI